MSHQQADHVCPPIIGYFLLSNPLRRLLYTPGSVLAPHVREGMTVIEPGPGMGFFTLEIARRVGSTGRVVALDIQQKMLRVLAQRAERADLLGRVDLRLIKKDGLGINDLKGKADFFLAFAMVHEVPNPRHFFQEAFASLKERGRLLLVEPAGHVSEALFKEELRHAENAGFRVESRPSIRMSRATVLAKSQRPEPSAKGRKRGGSSKQAAKRERTRRMHPR